MHTSCTHKHACTQVMYTVMGLPYQMSFGTSFLPTKYAGEGQSLNAQYVYTCVAHVTRSCLHSAARATYIHE